MFPKDRNVDVSTTHAIIPRGLRRASKLSLTYKTMATGIILCGGKSSRMGTPKAWLKVGGETVLARTIRILTEATSHIIVSAAAGQELPALTSNATIVRDRVPDRGPLGGLQSALETVDESAVAFVASCDLPKLTIHAVRTILAAVDAGFLAAIPVIDGRPQSLAAAYRATILPVVERHLAESRFSMKALLDAIPVRYLDGLDPAVFANVNTPDDYAKLS